MVAGVAKVEVREGCKAEVVVVGEEVVSLEAVMEMEGMALVGVVLVVAVVQDMEVGEG